MESGRPIAYPTPIPDETQPNPTKSTNKTARGHELSFQSAASPEVSLYKYGVPRYDNLLLFAPATEQMAAGLDAAGVAAFVEKVRLRALAWMAACLHL